MANELGRPNEETMIRSSNRKAAVLGGLLLAAACLFAQAPGGGPILNLTATTANLAGTPDMIRINVLRWSTDAERDQLLAAWNMPAGPAAAAAGGGRGRGGAGRGGAAPDGAAAAETPAEDGNPPAAGRGGAAAGGRGGRGGGRGGRGGAAAEAPPATPEASLAAAIGKAQTVGYLWSSEVAGYALRYAVRIPAQGATGERIVFLTDRPLGANNGLWKPANAGAAPNYEFSAVEIHLNARGEGEGKASLTGKMTVDSAAKTFALDNYAAMPVILKNVKEEKAAGVGASAKK